MTICALMVEASMPQRAAVASVLANIVFNVGDIANEGRREVSSDRVL